MGTDIKGQSLARARAIHLGAICGTSDDSVTGVRFLEICYGSGTYGDCALSADVLRVAVQAAGNKAPAELALPVTLNNFADSLSISVNSL